MIDRPTIEEIGNVLATVQRTRDTWHGQPAYARFLDIELHALKLLLIVTRIENEETNIAQTMRTGETANG